jgi:3-oxoacyl-[acyl-carrier-protein] synthase II
MTMRASLIGLGWVSAGGMGPAGAAPGFAVGEVLPEIARKDLFAEADRRFGRLDAFSRLGLAGVTFALRDAGLETWSEKRPLGVIAASRFGCLSTDSDYFDTVIPEGGKLASPNLFAYTLPNSFLGEVALRFGLTGSSFIVSGDRPGCLAPLRLALEALCAGEETTVVAGALDLPAPPGLAAPAGDFCGAVHAVLTLREGACYGQIALDRNDRPCFDGTVLTGWPQLVELCRAKVPTRCHR